MALRTYPEGGEHPGPIGRTIAESEPAWPVPPPTPTDAPNVLVMVLSDNGASAAGAQQGRLDSFGYVNGVPESIEDLPAHLDDWGPPHTHPHYASGWAMAGGTPNRMYKAFVHEGGTRDPLIVSWPGHVVDESAIRTQFHHICDLTPTILEAIGLEWPESADGHQQRPVEGTSLLYTFGEPDAPTRK